MSLNGFWRFWLNPNGVGRWQRPNGQAMREKWRGSAADPAREGSTSVLTIDAEREELSPRTSRLPPTSRRDVARSGSWGGGTVGRSKCLNASICRSVANGSLPNFPSRMGERAGSRSNGRTKPPTSHLLGRSVRLCSVVPPPSLGRFPWRSLPGRLERSVQHS